MITIENPILAEYRNGNTFVALYRDGTKVRSWEGAPRPEYPESIDLKITDRCDGGCRWCHEDSSPVGEHAPAMRVVGITSGMLEGTEVAIGGGDPLGHPEIGSLMVYMREIQGLVPNLTVNGKHLERHGRTIARLRQLGVLFGLGVSYTPGMNEKAWREIADENTVMHFIAGKDAVEDAIAWVQRQVEMQRPAKMLVMGYKRYGRGAQADWEAGERTRLWIAHLSEIISKADVVAFDNLALAQLRVRDMVAKWQWEESYMGADGQWTMYVDAVRDEFGASSTAERMPREGRSVKEMFKMVRRDK